MNAPRQSTDGSSKVQGFDLEQFSAQQQLLSKQGRMHWMHWFIVGLSLLITVIAWRTSESALDRQDKLRFDREADRVVSMIRERIEHYEDALLSGVAAMQTNGGKMSRSEWHRYASFLKLPERYPGINGIGVIHYVDSAEIPSFLSEVRIEAPDFAIHPEHIYDLSLPITYIEPEHSNAAAIGLDVAFETNRRTAALYARKTGNTQISGPIVLVQDDGKTPGFLFYAPYYDFSNVTYSQWTDQHREERFLGLIYAPLVVKNLVEGVLSAENRRVSLSIRDGDTVLYEEPPIDAADLFSSTENIQMHGRTWSLELVSQPSLKGDGGSEQPKVVLISGLCLDLMLFGLFWMMTRTNRHTLSMAEAMTHSLAAQAQQMSENNRDLESFAHVVSHDLKTPLRNIHSVIDILDEDYGQYLASNDEGLDIKIHLNTLQDQATRSQTLIDGILDYSTLGADAGLSSTVDTRALLENIGRQHELSPSQLTLSGSFPTLTTNATLLEQVLSNLIGNAIKYNPQAETATVRVSVSQRLDHYRFAVADNGPGIDARYHERIFLPFNTLDATMDIHSSGIGLSIVKRALELQGGSITLDSAPGQGSIFEFTWPANPADTEPAEYSHAA